MREHNAFIRHICDHPDDNTPRLIYADFLEEQGDRTSALHAELIRWQVRGQPPRMTSQPGELEAALGSHWIGPPVPGLLAWEYRRGFVESITLDGRAFPAAIGQLFERHPIRELKLAHVDGNSQAVARLAGSEWLGRVETLRFEPTSFSDPGLGDQGLEVLLDSPHLGRLRTLDLDRQRLTNVSARLLANCRMLPGLRALRLRQNRPNPVWPQAMDAGALENLAHGSIFSSLESLELENVPLGIKGCEAFLSASPGCLTELTLARCDLGPDQVRLLAESPALIAMTALDLKHNYLGADGALMLSETDLLRPVLQLNVSSNSLTDAGAARMVCSGVLNRLVKGSFRRNRLGDRFIAALGDAPQPWALEELDIAYNEIGVTGARRLISARTFPNLRALDLRKNRVSGNQKKQIHKWARKGRFCRV